MQGANPTKEELKEIAFKKHREAELAFHAYFQACDGNERAYAFQSYESIRTATRKSRRYV